MKNGITRKIKRNNAKKVRSLERVSRRTTRRGIPDKRFRIQKVHDEISNENSSEENSMPTGTDSIECKKILIGFKGDMLFDWKPVYLKN